VKAFGNKTCLIPVNAAISLAFDAKHPLAANDVHRGMRSNQCPSAMLYESMKFISHSSSPVLRFDSFRETCLTVNGAQRGNEGTWERISNCAISVDFGFVNLQLRASGNRMSAEKSCRRRKSRGTRSW
jgi:hypothetical protein